MGWENRSIGQDCKSMRDTNGLRPEERTDNGIILDIRQMSADVRGFQLKDITIQLQKGYIMGVVGRNGSGKTSLIKTICNVNPKLSGSITVNGYDSVLEEVLVKDEIGVVMEELAYFAASCTIWENAKLIAPLYRTFDWNILDNYLKKYNVIKDKEGDDNKYGNWNKPLADYSKGEQIRIKIAFALAHHPKLLILDEPTANLDSVFRRQLLDDLQELVETEEISVLLCTHITTDLDRVGDYIVILDEGEIVANMSKEELMELYPYGNIANVVLQITGNSEGFLLGDETDKKEGKSGIGKKKCKEQNKWRKNIKWRREDTSMKSFTVSNYENTKKVLHYIYKRSWYGRVLFGVYVFVYCFYQTFFCILYSKAYDDTMQILMMVCVAVLSGRYYDHHFELHTDKFYSFAGYLPISSQDLKKCLWSLIWQQTKLFGTIQLVLCILLGVSSDFQGHFVDWNVIFSFLFTGLVIPLVLAVFNYIKIQKQE